MKERPKKLEPSEYLSGWKEIANYLGKGVRTTQRYERELGLPVRRPAGKPSGSVVAVKAELDGWVQASPIREMYPLHVKEAEEGYAKSANAIKQGLEKMTQLKEQMTQLRSELRGMVLGLRQSVQELQSGLNRNRWEESAPWAPREEDVSRKRN